jgi:hypothetical protein
MEGDEAKKAHRPRQAGAKAEKKKAKTGLKEEKRLNPKAFSIQAPQKTRRIAQHKFDKVRPADGYFCVASRPGAALTTTTTATLTTATSIARSCSKRKGSTFLWWTAALRSHHPFSWRW